ncbi:hypothetical protein [Pseudooceanicola sp. MF1-13]|uniref:hypothetical protein n=1 Tax=Pseudooceanicola sp. MF1-13 TaxID=3379095 RepID=UPI0038923795
MNWTIVDRAANLAAIAAFVVAAYAIIFPATVSDFLDEISESNKRLADELPYWISFSESYEREVLNAYSTETGGAATAIALENRGNFVLRDIEVRLFDQNGKRVDTRKNIFLTPFGGYTAYMSGPTGSFDEGMSICVGGYSSRAEKYLYEWRILVREGVVGFNTMSPTDYVFTDEGWPAPCEV